MSLLNANDKPKRGSHSPDERVRLTPSLVVALWSYRDERGNRRVRWSIDRHNEQDPETPFRMCEEGDVLELGLFAQRLSLALARKETLSLPLRKRLAQYANALAQADELMREEQGNGAAETDDSERNRVLSFE